jgi:hypothetical protein
VRVLVRRVMKWVVYLGGAGGLRLQPETGTAARRALETYRSENIRDSHTAVALPRRGAPRSLESRGGAGRVGAGAYGKRYRPFGTTLFTLQHSSMSGAVKSRQVTVKSPSPSTLTSTQLLH